MTASIEDVQIPSPVAEFFEASVVPLTLTTPDLPDNPIVLVNEALCHLTKYGRGEIIGRNCRFLQGEAENGEARSKIRKCLADAEEDFFLLTNYRKTGEEFLNFLYISPIKDAGGAVRFFVGSQYDVTTQVQDWDVEQHANHLTRRIMAANAALRGEGALQIEAKIMRSVGTRLILQTKLDAWERDGAA